jgi:ATP/maltotriose-dependent transcriptional regulator MalT
MLGDIKALSGVNISRTNIPSLPPGYLTRKHLFPLLDNSAPGTTLVIAPAGYGKSSLVAQWAQGKQVIWMTLANGDSLNEMSAMLILATRNAIPGFGMWFEKEQPMRPTEVVRRWGNELLQRKEEIVFVLDNLRDGNLPEVAIEVRLIEEFPSNLHFVAIRREAIESIYSTCASRGPLKVITVQDLRFTEDETYSLAQSTDQVLDQESKDLLFAANGWPAATSLLLQHIENSKDDLDLANIMSSNIEPLRALALFVINELDPKIVRTAEVLSLLQVFDFEVAEYLLGPDFSQDLISSIAIKGEIFSPSWRASASFTFSPMMRQVFLERMRRNTPEKMALHRRLVDYFEKRGNLTLAIEHAFESGDGEKISELFPDAARIKQCQGRGGDLIRWSAYAALNPDEGYLKSLTVKIVGLIVNLDFAAAKAEIDRLASGAEESPAKEFYLQFVAGAQSYIDISAGNFDVVAENVHRAIYQNPPCYLGVDDQVNLYRAQIIGHYIFDEIEKVEKVAGIAKELMRHTKLDSSHAFLLSIEAMLFHQRGEYRRAHELASMAIAACKKHDFVGVHGPLDAMYVKARCLFEFSNRAEGIALLEELRRLAFQWKQWHWYFAAENNLIQDLCLNQRHKDAIERIRESRLLISTFEFSHNLDVLIDLNEMYIRRSLGDFDRLKKLISRVPNVRYVRHMQQQIDEQSDLKKIRVDFLKLPESTPRDQIWKHLTEACLNIDAEQIALPALQKALKIGALVGAKETFLRQENQIGNLILKIANENPTVYNEELASAMAERMRDRGEQMNEGRPALTKRELEILRQLSTGRTLTVIAEELHISQNTMKTHLKNLYRKMEADGRKDAVEKASTLFLL